MKQPFKGYFRISQHFGGNGVDIYKARGDLGHGGTDFAMPIGTPILSSVNGVVIGVSTDIQKGLGIAVLSSDKFEYNGQKCLLSTVYWHLSRIDVKIGEKVKAQQQIGLSGNTGITSGPHLHLSITPLDLKGKKMLTSPNNGYRGHINPLPYLELEPEDTKVKELQELLIKYGAKIKADNVLGPLTLRAFHEIYD